MDYLILNHTDPNAAGPEPGTPEFGEFMGRWMAYNQMLIDGGHWIAGASLSPPDPFRRREVLNAMRPPSSSGA